MRAVLFILLVGLTSTAFGQEKAFEPLQNEKKAPVKQPAAVERLPTVGNLTQDEREKLMNDFIGIKKAAVAAPNIFQDPKKDIKPSPPEAVYKAVLADLQAMNPDDRSMTRYLSLYAIEPKDRKNHITIASFVLNSLSWSHKVSWPSIVPGTDDGLIKFNILQYSRGLKNTDVERWVDTWELMTSADVFFLEPWVSREDSLAAKEMTGSVGCVLRADWFNFYAIQDDDPATKNAVEGFYSRFLGLPNNEAELLKLLSVDLTDLANKGVDRAGIVTISGTGSDAVKVARNNRKINRTPSILTPYGGYFYYTQDVLNSQGGRNFINNPLSDFKDGGEYIWRLPNGLQGYFLTQRVEVKEGNRTKVVFNRIAEVPIAVATDSHFDDKRVKIRSCAYCHQNGINKYTDTYSLLVAPKAPGGLVKPATHDPSDIIRLDQLFFPDTPAYVVADQMNYQQSLFMATGMTSGEFRNTYKACLDSYDAPVTPGRAVWEFGVQDIQGLEDFLADKVVSTTRGSLLELVKGMPIQRDTFEEEFKNGKLLQEIKANIKPKNGVALLSLVVPSLTTVPDVKIGPTVQIAAGGTITTKIITPLYATGSTQILVNIPVNTALTIIKVNENAGRQYANVVFNGRNGWILLDK